MARRKRTPPKETAKDQAVEPSAEAGQAAASQGSPAKAGGKKAARRARQQARAAAKAQAPKQPAKPAQAAPVVANPTPELGLVDDLPAVAIGLLCAILPAVVHPGVRDLYQLPKTFALTTGAAWTLAAIALLALMGRKLRLPKTPLLWPLVGLIASIAIGVAVAPSETGGVLSIFAKMDAYRWGAALVVGIATLVTVRNPRQLFYVVGGMLVGGFQVAIYGIAQHHNIDGLLPAEASRWVGINKPGSTFGNRNMAAQLIVSVMPAGYVLIAMALRWWRRGRAQLAVVIGASANILLFVLLYYLRLSVTRSAWGGAALGVLVAAVVFGVGRLLGRKSGGSAPADDTERDDAARRPGRSALPLIAGLVLSGGLAIALASNVLIDRGFKAQFDQGVGDQKRRMSITELASTVTDFDKPHWSMRFMMWASTWEAIKARPTGGGAGNWRVLFPQYVTQRENNDHFSISKQPTRAHNDFLQFWSEFGLQGFISLMALLLVVAWMSVRTVVMQTPPAMREREDVAWMTLAAVTSLAGIVAICGDALLSFPFQLPAPTFLFFVHVGVIGAAWVYVREQQWQTETPTAPRPFSVPTLLPAPAKGVVAIAALSAVWFVHHENPRLMEAEKGFTAARAKQKRGRPSAALIEIKKAIAINPDDFQNHFIEALCHNSLRDAAKSVTAIQQSLKLYPNLLNAWVNLAMFAQKAGQTEVMEDAIKTALALKPDEVYALNVKARYLMRRGKYKAAAATLKPYLERHRHNRSYLANAERAFRRLGEWATVAQINTWQVQNLKARRLRPGQRNYKRLRARDAARLRKGRLNGWAKVGDTWVKAKRWDKALPAYAEAAARAGKSRGDLKRKYALALASQRRWAKAKHEIGVALHLAKSEGTLLTSGLQQQRANAKSAEDKAQLDTLLAYVARLSASGDAKTKADAKAARDADDDAKISAAWKRAAELRAKGDEAGALSWFKRAAERGRARRADVKRVYAVALARAGQWQRAFHEAEVAVHIDAKAAKPLVEALEKLRASAKTSKAAKAKLADLIAKVGLL